MIDKDTILELILRECDICLHLYEKIPEGGLDYRPTPGQRSTLELLRYLSFCAIAGARTMAEGSWDSYQECAQGAADLAGEDFPAAMERQKEQLRAFFDGLTQEKVETHTAILPLGEAIPLEKALVLLPLEWMVAYRMQLFLYCKQAGNEEIWTPDCWAGVTMERPVPESSPTE